MVTQEARTRVNGSLLSQQHVADLLLFLVPSNRCWCVNKPNIAMGWMSHCSQHQDLLCEEECNIHICLDSHQDSYTLLHRCVYGDHDPH
ncbi:hypothetical protein Pmani_006238 [Petrolisthes manimaculis]|uniref:Uncharacterized protein n=1 Tax=Petrolisthes manimaculis TaxID=1843537 RepID=A0AAE1QAQ2_9EUCA|nr:hypothetical protein Pmani_006238 [Petrolisthes manimaculis]